MIKGKKGIFLAIYLPLMTLFMCGLMVLIYYYQANDTPNNLVSAKAVLELQDQKDIYELWENQTIYDSIGKAGLSADAIKEKFCSSFAALDIKIRNVTYPGNNPAEFCNNQYNFILTNKQLNVERKVIIKSFKISASDKSKINFPVSVEYSFQKKYLINL